MNIQSDPVGYRTLARHLREAAKADSERAREAAALGRYVRIIAVALALLALLAIVAVLNATRDIAMPVAMAAVIGLVLGPICDRLAAWRIPRPLTALLAVSVVLAAIVAALYAITPSVGELNSAIPKVTQSLQNLVRNVESALSFLDAFRKVAAPGDSALLTETKSSPVDMAARVAGLVTPAVAQIVIFVFTLMLFAAARPELRIAAARMFRTREQRLAVLHSITKAERKLAEYVLVVGGVNAALGLTVSGLFWLVGVPGAPVWGFIAFIANFLPVVGPLAVKAALVLFGLVTYPTIAGALTPAAIFLCLSLTEANLVTPHVIAQKVTISPFTVFLSVIFGAWLWGFAGALLAMPLLAIYSVVRDEMSSEPSSRFA